METTHQYRGFGVTYYTIGGTTEVWKNGSPIKSFKNLGEKLGKSKAHNYIDKEWYQTDKEIENDYKEISKKEKQNN